MRGNRIAADVDQRRRQEEHHVRRIADDRVYERPFIEVEGGEAVAPGLDRAGKAHGTCADDEDVHEDSMSQPGGAGGCLYLSPRTSVRNQQPSAQLPGGFVGGLAVEGHEDAGTSGCALDLRPPFAGIDAGDLDEVLAPVDGFVVAVNVHVGNEETEGDEPSF